MANPTKKPRSGWVRAAEETGVAEETLPKRACYLILVGVMGVAYFLYAVGVGLWEFVKDPFNNDKTK